MRIWFVLVFLSISSIFLFPFLSIMRNFITIFAGITYGFAFYGCMLAPIIIAVINFSKTMYGNRAYLTHSIPVKISKIVLSKLLTFFFLLLLGEVFSIIIMFISTAAFTSKEGMELIMKYADNLTGYPFLDLLIQVGIPVYLSFMTIMCAALCSQSLAQRINPSKRKTLSFLVFIILYGLISIAAYFMGHYEMAAGNYLGVILFNILVNLILVSAILSLNSKKLRV